MRYELNIHSEPFETDWEFDEASESFDTELADWEWEEEAARRRRPRPAVSRARRGARVVSRKRPPKRLIKSPFRPPIRPPRPPIRPPRPVIFPTFPLPVVSVGEPRPPQPPAPAGAEPAGAAPAPAGGSPAPSSAEPPSAEPSAEGSEHVRWVQDSLNRILGLRLPVDGIMGLEVRSAVRSFQERQGLPITGLVGPDTERALIAASSGQSRGAAATKPDEPGMTEPPEPAATPPEPDTATPASELSFEWEEDATRGQRETQRPAARPRMVDPAKVSCAKLDRSLPIFKAIGTKDPVGVLEALSQRAVEMLDNTITEMNRIRERVRAGKPLAWPLIGDLLAWSLKTRMLMPVNDPKVWTDKGTVKNRRTAGLIIRWLSNIRKIIAGGHLRYTCLATSHCGPSTWAWVFCDKYRINLCRRFWHPKTGIDAVTHFEFQAQTIIHEASHIYYCTEDTGLGPGAAECISQFVADANGSPIDKDFVGRCGLKGPTLP